MENKIEFTAFHEAGHVVAAVLFEIDFEWVTIIPDEETGSLGHIHPSFSFDISGLKRSLIEQKKQFLFAGEMAERKARKWASGIGFLKDYMDAAGLAESLYEDEDSRREFLMEMIEKARILIAENWPSVEAIQKELFIIKNLSITEIKQILMTEKGKSSRQRE
jgi:ATP-dependent Zn protease